MNLWRDFLFGLRLLVKRPGFTAVAILALALGIGPNTALFSIVHAAFFEPLGYPEPDRLVMVWYHQKGREITGSGVPVAAGDILEYQKATGVFESLSPYIGSGAVLTGMGEPEDLRINIVAPSQYSHTLRRKVLLGRAFLPEEADPGKDHAVILSYRFWQARFGGDPNVIGRQIRLNQELYTVVGVDQRNKVQEMVQAKIPLGLRPPQTNRHGAGGYWMIGRMNPGVTVQQAQAELDRIAANLARAYPNTNRNLRIRVDPLQAAWVPQTTKTTLWLLAAAVGFVLLIACANVASLMLARATTRQREIAIRSALGASGKRLFMQVLVESLTVSLAGCLAGAALGWALLRLILTKAPSASLTVEADPRLSIPVLLFTALVAIVSGALFGCVPAWQARRPDLNEALKLGAGAGTSLRHLWLRRSLVAIEFAAAMTLLTGASIAVHTLWKRSGEDIGIGPPEKILVFAFVPPREKMKNPDETAVFYRDAISALEAVPGVQRVTAADTYPMGGREIAFEIGGQAPEDGPARLTAQGARVTNGYFETYNIPILAGRSFDARDAASGEPVAMVNQEFARRFLGTEAPLGRQLVLEEAAAGQPAPVRVSRRIVGVYRNVIKAAESGRSYEPEIAVPAAQGPGIVPMMAVRTAGPADRMRQPIARALARVAPDTPMRMASTVAQMADDWQARERMYTVLFGSMALVALLLSAVGIYGVMGFLVAQRTREMGLRLALGASRNNIIAMVVREGLLLAVGGLALGSIGAWAAERGLQALLGEVQKIDVAALAAAAALLLICALVACSVPACKASKADPISALRLS